MSDNVLKVLGPTSVDDYTPALYVVYGPLADVWVRATYRADLSPGGQAIFVAGFTQWVDDQAYYGDWGVTGGIALVTARGSTPAFSELWNAFGSEGPPSVNGPDGAGGGSEVYDLRVHYSGTPNEFDSEVWHNDVQVWATHHVAHIDPGHPDFTSTKALVIFNRSSDAHSIYMDDISVGTSRGAADLVAVQTFDSAFGDFVVDDGDTGGMVDSFSIYTVPGGGGGGGGGGQIFQAILV